MPNKDREKTLEPSLKRWVEEKKKGFCIKLVTLHISGLPDRMCLMPQGIIFFVETKTTGDEARPLQLWMHAKLRKLGFKVYILDSKEIMEQIKLEYAG